MKKNGFTLIELMVTVLIVGVLASISIPTYQNFTMKTRRTEGKSLIMDIMQRQEKYYNENNTYTTNLTQLGYPTTIVLSDKGYYAVTATAAIDGITNNVILTADPKDTQVKDTECGSYILNSTGLKTTSTSLKECWYK